jgi:hypothetical protein
MKASAGQIINEVAEQPNSAEVVAVLRGAFVESARRAAITAMIFVLIGFSISWLLPDTGPAVEKEVGHEPLPGDPSAEPSGA